MQPWRLALLGSSRFPRELSEFEIGQFFLLSPAEQSAVKTRRGELNRLGAAIHLGFIKMTGCTLSNVDHIPTAVLRFLRDTMALPSPNIASLRALYRRSNTLFEHQGWAAKFLGFEPYNDRRERWLLRHLRNEAREALTVPALIDSSKRWLFERRILIPAGRTLRTLASRVYREAEAEFAASIRQRIPGAVLEHWLQALFAETEESPGEILIEWLKTPPKRATVRTLSTELAKLNTLKALEVHSYPIESLPLKCQQGYARRMRWSRPGRFRARKEPRRTLELVCFLRMRLLELSDGVLALADLDILKIRRRAHAKTAAAETTHWKQWRRAWRPVRAILEDPTLSDQEVRQRLLALVPADPGQFPSRAAALRHQLAEQYKESRAVLKKLLTLDFEAAEPHPIHAALKSLHHIYEQGLRALPAETDIDFAPPWGNLLRDPDRERALHAFEAAVLLNLRKALRNGSIWLGHSLSYRRRDELLIARDHWTETRREHYARLGLPEQPTSYLRPLLANLEVGLAGLAEAARQGVVRIDAEGLHLDALEAEPEHPLLAATRQAIERELGAVQFSEVMVAIDSQTHFSWALLGRPPHSEDELSLLYGAVLAHGTELNAGEVALMIPGLTEARVAEAMPFLEDPARLRMANNAVLDYLLRHPITRIWGEGTWVSSDAMSLEASRHLWNARVDPKRRTYSIGLYTHVLDRWGVIYDQPIVLKQRQAGAAIEGMIRQSAAEEAERLAVDTHGYSDFAMAVAKMLGFDLCPRLKNLRDRRLHVPRDMNVPPELETITRADVSLKGIEAGWDELVRVVASIQTGWTSAPLALERFGSASRADPVQKAGTALGQLTRTLFLCDYATLALFRRELLRILDHGELVHTLQRAIHFGSIAAARGGRREELIAISGSLALLTNIVLAWATQRIQMLLDQWKQQGDAKADPDLLRHTSPVHYRGINFRGEFHFPFVQYRERLLPHGVTRTPVKQAHRN